MEDETPNRSSGEAIPRPLLILVRSAPPTPHGGTCCAFGDQRLFRIPPSAQPVRGEAHRNVAEIRVRFFDF